MLTLTDSATALVTTLVRRRTDAEGVGLRIHTADAAGQADQHRLAADVVVAPEPEAVQYVKVCDAYGAGKCADLTLPEAELAPQAG